MSQYLIQDLTITRDDEMDQDVFFVSDGTQELGHVRMEGDWGQERGRYAAWSLKTCTTIGFFGTLDEAVAAITATHLPLGPGGTTKPHKKLDDLDFGIMPFARRVRILNHAASLYGNGRTVGQCWNEALAADRQYEWDNRVLPAEDTYKMCMPERGGEVHTAQVYEAHGHEYFYPLCRTMGQNSRMTAYRYVDLDITCAKCAGYRGAREAHRNR